VLGPGFETTTGVDRSRGPRSGRYTTTEVSASVANVSVDLELILDNGIGAEGRAGREVTDDVASSSKGGSTVC
jgi:hypothetical protein